MMKRLSKSIVVTLMLLIGAQSASAQTFSKMSETKRNAELVKMARKLYHSKFLPITTKTIVTMARLRSQYAR